jgi:hypothetical protein
MIEGTGSRTAGSAVEVRSSSFDFDFGTWAPEGKALPSFERVKMSIEEARETGSKGAWVTKKTRKFKLGMLGIGTSSRWVVVQPDSPTFFLVYFKKPPNPSADTCHVDPKLPEGALGAYSVWELRDAFWNGERLKVQLISLQGKYKSLRGFPPAFFLSMIICMRYA